MENDPQNPIAIPPENRLPQQATAEQAISPTSPVLIRPIILGDLTLASPTTVTTIGANGAATALTANPVGYIVVMVGNTAVQIPYYTVA